MKRLLALPVLAALLASCGAGSGPEVSVPAVSVGNLLLAPLQLPVGGIKVRVKATPLLGGNCAAAQAGCRNFTVPVRLYTVAGNLPPLKVTGVYVVTEGGVWRSGVQSGDNRLCNTRRCLVATARGNAELEGGEAVQVVVSLKDAQGRQYRLRDQKATVQ